MEMLQSSTIVAAHPDDENLWFSSILAKVDQVVLCFLAVPSNPVWTEGRRRSLASYPLANVACLELTESEVFWGVDWHCPIETEYGVRITDRRLSDKTYIGNFDILKNKLRAQLQGYRNVFTHNPWGEYGHVEHIQVYRAVKALQREMGFNLWFSNYASNKSAGMMTTVLAGGELHSVTLQTDKGLAGRIADIYKANDCWTWYDDYAWCDSETFIRDCDLSTESRGYGRSVSINFIKIEPPPVKMSPLKKFVARVKRKVRG